jgi:hypothetical protein
VAFDTNVEYQKRRNKWPKKYRREFLAMHDNADTLLQTLDQGVSVEQCKNIGFLHAKYSLGLLSIDQKGAGAGVKQCRLYVFPDVDQRTLHLITIGDKSTQGSDVAYATRWVTDHLDPKGSEDSNG